MGHRKTYVAAAVLAGLVFFAGCETAGQSGTLIGAGGGALAGQAIGHNTTGTLIGAGVGAVGGYIVGNEMDKKKAREQQEAANARANSSYNSGSNYSSSSSGTNSGAAAVTVPSNNGYRSSTPAPAPSGEVATINIKNSNGSTTPVTLHKQGTDWVGEKGEHYDHLPTEAELKPIYGI